MDFVKHMQIDIINLNKEVHELKKQNRELQKWIGEFKEIIGHNVVTGNLLSIVMCKSCDGSGHIWPDDACKCCDNPIDCVKCKGKGEYWGKLCG